ncbi:NUDIX domain-containing protein [Streptomyces verrucosisporus]|uniref:NUDIX domain-containing protein n=1 Tax=Streptomyces verrucosisporus TaxID=1695161 RepID=UPI001F12755F|nr:NUDIX hydrolase [Streptomyces verrucosisporus]
MTDRPADGRVEGHAGPVPDPVACPPAARVVCLDAADRVLLLEWRDPYDGSRLWEPPGGGIEPGETPRQVRTGWARGLS